MRIIAGKLGGRRLDVPRGDRVRPTADRTKESLFNILGERCLGARVLDAFAGSGALGLEAWSRGASRVVLVEQDPVVLRVLQQNVAALVPEALAAQEVRVVRADVMRACTSGALGVFDLVFVDPPYRKGLAPPLVAALVTGGVLARGALVVVERDRRDEVSWPDTLTVRDERRYGDTVLTLLDAPA